MDLPRQGRPLLLGEGNGCAQNDVQPIQGSITRGDIAIGQSRKYCKPLWCSWLVQQFRVCMPLFNLVWWMSRGEMTTIMEGIPPGPYNSLDRNYLFVS